MVSAIRITNPLTIKAVTQFKDRMHGKSGADTAERLILLACQHLDNNLTTESIPDMNSPSMNRQ